MRLIRIRVTAVFVAAVLAALFTGCATTHGPMSASGKPIPKATLDAARQRVDQEQIPPNLKPYYFSMYSEGRENLALYEMRGGLEALRSGELDQAEKLLQSACEDVDALLAGANEARKAQGKFTKEQEKWFKGESYERSALFMYRGLIYLIRHDFGNASACFKRAQLYDITSDDEPGFAGDWYSAEWALALASLKQGYPQDADAALKRAAGFSSRRGEVPPPGADCNTLIVVEAGIGPIKYRAGRYGELMRYREEPSPVKTVEILQGDNVLTTSAAAESLYFQATTRGKREVDSILNGKAQFKQGTAIAATGLAAGALIAAQHGGQGGDIAAGVLGGLALISAGLSAATTPQADIRTWDNLPHSLYFLCLSLPPGESTFSVMGKNAAGSVLRIQELKPVIHKDDPLQVIFVRF
jgi:tetratricopeptide (TPR) repeat protein